MNKSSRYRKLPVKLGEGSYKTVTKAIDEEEGKEVAYNEVKIKSYEHDSNSASCFSKEIALLKNMNHPYIIKIFDYWFTDDEFIFITELMTGGTLRDYIQKVGPLNSKLIKKWGKQILEGLKYLHNMDPPIIHRDIKNENIFVNSSQGEIKIGDLGIAKEKKHKRYTIVGTPHFMAREMFEGEGYSEKVDIYAFGMCLIEMVTGRTPYNELNDTTDVYKNILSGVLPQAIHQVSDNCLKGLIMGCLVPQFNRYSAAQCLDHHFFHSDVICDGNCLPKDCATIFPLCPPIKDMELSLVSFNENIITFQILLVESLRFIKFDYDLENDTLEKVSRELHNEKILKEESLEAFMKLLETGIEKAKLKKESGKIRDGIVELSSQEILNLTDNFRVSNSCHKEKLFGDNTLEVMQEIEEEMKMVEKRKEMEKRREEEITQRLKAKLEHKNANYEISENLNSNNQANNEIHKSANVHNGMNNLNNNINSNNGINLYNNGVSNTNFNNTALNNSNIINNNGINNANLSNIPMNSCNSPVLNSVSSIPMANNMILNTINSNIHSNRNLPTNGNISPNSNINQNNMHSNANIPSNLNSPNAILNNSFNLNNISTALNNPEDDIYVNHSFNKSSENAVLSPDCNKAGKAISSPPISSPPFSSAKLTEEQAVNDLSLNESYEICKNKFRQNYMVSQFSLDAASITGRTEDTAKSWIKALKDEDFESVFDLKLIVYEDWEKLPLTVFSCRAMQNMLYGIDNIPLKEKQLAMNPKLKDYDNKLPIKEFLEDVCASINRTDIVSNWENKLMAQDVRTVGELKSLHQDDWNRLGLSVFAYRILKNVIFRKGKIVLE
jgi:serine/threonine protein kinase